MMRLTVFALVLLVVAGFLLAASDVTAGYSSAEHTGVPVLLPGQRVKFECADTPIYTIPVGEYIVIVGCHD